MHLRIGDIAQVAQGLAVSGRGAGARSGDWELQLAESADIADDRLDLDRLRTISIEQNPRTEKHLLRPYDVLVTARAQSIKVALVPPAVSRTAAGATLLVIRPHRPESGAGHWLWYFLTSRGGRSAVARRVRLGVTIPSLPASSLADVAVPMPSDDDLHRLAELIETSELAYQAGVHAARVRREQLRDSLVGTVSADSPTAP